MCVVYYCTAIVVCLNLGNSLGGTRDQLFKEERLSFFDAELFQVFNEGQRGNLLISPIGIKLVLGMLMEGAEGASGEEIRAVLRFPHDAEARRKEFNTWLSRLQVNEPWSILKMASRVFMSDRYTPGYDYQKTLERYYSAGITKLRFENSREATRTINDWVCSETSCLIPNVVEEGDIHADHKLFMSSAVYFKGVWSQPFESELSVMRCFYSSDNVCNDALMMTETGNFYYGYISRLEAKAVLLPYKGGQFSMLILMPSIRESVESLGRDLIHVSLGSILSEMTEQEITVQIPQFEITYNEDIVKRLNKLGISRVFGPSANLSKMFENHSVWTSVSGIYQSAKITVTEEGSEAAAATGALFVPLMGGTTTSFVANRPFLFFVINSSKNFVLFAGKVVTPLTSQSSDRSSILHSNPEKISLRRTYNSPQPKPTTPVLSRRHDYFQLELQESPRESGFPENPSQEAKHIQRGQSPGAKFRAIRPLSPARERPSKVTPSVTYPWLRRNLPSEQVISPKETQRYAGREVAPEQSRTDKGQKRPADDWIHRALYFA